MTFSRDRLRAVVRLIAAGLLLALTAAAASAQRNAPAWLPHGTLLEMHEALIWAANLNAEAGQVPRGELDDAIKRFRARIGSPQSGPITISEHEELLAQS
ncbi:MAG TPA: hypothetical protein PK264_05525, partial [Hyphomicrobiaceae bacterium]|nr:hypothetical protein [Hyphomicrobiaceae bacterium]